MESLIHLLVPLSIGLLYLALLFAFFSIVNSLRQIAKAQAVMAETMHRIAEKMNP